MTGQLSPAAELREAAALIRERTAPVPPSPWHLAESHVSNAITADRECLNVIASAVIPERARFMALWQPATALAIAAELELEADIIDRMGAAHDPGYSAGYLRIARACLGTGETGA